MKENNREKNEQYFKFAGLAGISAIGAMLNYNWYGKTEALGLTWVAWAIFTFYIAKMLLTRW